jgi:hypothetical protein
VRVAAATWDGASSKITFRVEWDTGGYTEEEEGDPQSTFFATQTHADMELGREVIGKMIRVYWIPEKNWYTGKIASFDAQTLEHTINYEDGETSNLDLLELDKYRPAWEFAPFTEKYFKGY